MIFNSQPSSKGKAHFASVVNISLNLSSKAADRWDTKREWFRAFQSSAEKSYKSLSSTQTKQQQNQACVRKLVSYSNQIFVLIPLVVL